jgi:hypothetical protein
MVEAARAVDVAWGAWEKAANRGDTSRPGRREEVIATLRYLVEAWEGFYLAASVFDSTSGHAEPVAGYVRALAPLHAEILADLEAGEARPDLVIAATAGPSR